MANYYLPLLRDKVRGGNSFSAGAASSTINLIIPNNNANANVNSIIGTVITTAKTTETVVHESTNSFTASENLLVESKLQNVKSKLPTEYVENKNTESTSNQQHIDEHSKIDAEDRSMQATHVLSSITETITSGTSITNQTKESSNRSANITDSIKKVFNFLNNININKE